MNTRRGTKTLMAWGLMESIKKAGVEMSPFENALKKSISDKIREMKREGTVSMSMENLMQVVRPPSSSLEGAPRGTNARYYYVEMFRDLCGKEFRSFVK